MPYSLLLDMTGRSRTCGGFERYVVCTYSPDMKTNYKWRRMGFKLQKIRVVWIRLLDSPGERGAVGGMHNDVVVHDVFLSKNARTVPSIRKHWHRTARTCVLCILVRSRDQTIAPISLFESYRYSWSVFAQAMHRQFREPTTKN